MCNVKLLFFGGVLVEASQENPLSFGACAVCSHHWSCKEYLLNLFNEVTSEVASAHL